MNIILEQLINLGLIYKVCIIKGFNIIKVYIIGRFKYSIRYKYGK